jgi:hypothetical protein
LLVSNDGNNTQAISGAMSSSRFLVGGGVTNNVAIASGARLSSRSLAQGGTIVAPSTATIPNTTYVAVSLSLFEIEQCKSKVLVILIMFVKDQVIPYQLDVDDPKVCWTLFQQMYEPKNMIRNFFLRSKLYKLRMDDDVGSLNSYLQEFKEVCSQLAGVGVKIENEELVQILLNGFLESYESFVPGLCKLTALFTFEQIVGKLLHEEE